jgi:hypothetical protein
MPEAIIHTETVAPVAQGDGVKVTARLLEGTIQEGMFLYIPLNRMVNVTLLIHEIHRADGDFITLLVATDGSEEATELITFLNFANETLFVRDEGVE